MPVFHYKAKTFTGDIIFSSQEATSEKELAKSLFEKNYILISTSPEVKEEKISKLKLTFKRKISLVERMMFTRHLGVMAGAGFPFDKSLSVLANQTKNKKFKKIIFKVKEDLSKGESFSEALKKHPEVFSELYWNMVKVGEETGNLKEVLEVLADQMKKEYDLLSRVKGAMMYPAVIFAVMILIGVLMMVVILPKFSQIFKELEVELPLTTKIILKIGDVMSTYWYIFFLIIFALGFLIRFWVKTKTGKKIKDLLSLKLPLIGSLNIKINTARTSRIINSLLKSGVPIITTLKVLSGTLPNVYYKEAIESAIIKIQKGKTLHESLAPFEKIYSFLLIQMLQVGEETGKLDVVLGSLAEFYEGEVETTTKNLTTIIEPVLMIIIGAAVGFFALSIFQPIYSMMGVL